MKKQINIAVDIETLSKRSTAAIIGIAARAFDPNGGCVEGEERGFHVAIDATSCAMFGMDFDPGTVEWWSKKPEEVKKQFDNTEKIKSALSQLSIFIEDIKLANDADEVIIWCQGTDFDIPILRNAFVCVNNDREEKTLPWKYSNVRDSRTFILDTITRFIAPGTEDPYSLIPKREGWNTHDALSDVDQLIHNVEWVSRRLNDLLAQKGVKGGER